MSDEVRHDLKKLGRRNLKLLQSADLADRLSGLDSMVVPLGGCFIGVRLAKDLKTETCAYVVRTFLADDLRSLPADRQRSAISILCHIVAAKELKGVGKPLASLLSADEDPGFRLQLLDTLRVIHADDCVAEVLPLLSSPLGYMRREALAALVEWNSKEAIPYLIVNLDPDDPNLKAADSFHVFSALQGLAKLRAIEAAPAIVPLIRNPHPDLPHYALDALYKLGARDQAAAIRPLLDPAVASHTRAYAIAVSLAFDQPDVLPVAIAMATSKDLSDRSLLLEKLCEVRPPLVIPALIKVLEDRSVLGGDSGTDSNIRRDLMGCLASLGSQQAILILRQYARDPRNGGFLQDAAVNALGLLRAKESAEDLLIILHRTNNADRSKTGKVAVALARLGEPTIWPQLLDYTDNPRNHSRNKVMNELNFFLDPNLWEAIHDQKVVGWSIVPNNRAARLITLENGVRVVLHVSPIYAKLMKAYDERQWGTGGETLGYILQLWQGQLSGLHDPMAGESFCYFFDDHDIHVLSVSSAVARWRSGDFHRFLEKTPVAEVRK